VTTELLDLLVEEDQKDVDGSTHEYGLLMTNEQDRKVLATGPTIRVFMDPTGPSISKNFHATTLESESYKELQSNKAIESLFMELKSSLCRNRAEIIAEAIAKMAESETRICDNFLEKAKGMIAESETKICSGLCPDKSSGHHSETEQVDTVTPARRQALVINTEHYEPDNCMQDVANIGIL
jgi:hypothetical protein